MAEFENSKSDEGWVPPAFYNFKPFFTLQPVQQTKEKQLKLWRELIMGYHIHHKISSMPDPYSWTFFKNTSSGVDRTLSREGIEAVVLSLISEGLAEWENSDQLMQNLIIMTESPACIASQLADWANATGNIDNMVTFYELCSGDGYSDAAFAHIDKNILRRALDVLVEGGKAIVIPGETGDEDGIKFLA